MSKDNEEHKGVANTEYLNKQGEGDKQVEGGDTLDYKGLLDRIIKANSGKSIKERFSEGITKFFEPLEKLFHKNGKDTQELETQKKALLTSLGEGWGKFSVTLADVQDWANGKLKNAQAAVHDMEGKANEAAHKVAQDAEKAWKGFVNGLEALQEKAVGYAKSAQESVTQAAGKASQAVHDALGPKLQVAKQYVGEKRAQFNEGVAAGKKSHAEKVQAERDAKQAAQIEGAPQSRSRH